MRPSAPMTEKAEHRLFRRETGKTGERVGQSVVKQERSPAVDAAADDGLENAGKRDPRPCFPRAKAQREHHQRNEQVHRSALREQIELLKKLSTTAMATMIAPSQSVRVVCFFS